MHCKFCQNETIIIIGQVKSPITGHAYSYYKCNNCKCYFFNDTQFPVDVSEVYESLATERPLLSNSFIRSKSWERQKQIIIKLLGHAPDSILDIGCRTGDFLMHFGPETHCCGVEISEQYAIIARQRGLEIINEPLENARFINQYEVVSCFAILEHLQNPIEFLTSVHNLVQPGGMLVIMIPSAQTIKARYSKLNWHMLSPPEHLNFFSRSFLDNYLKENQFVKIKRNYSSGGMLIYKGKNHLIKKAEALLNQLIDLSFIGKLPVFDHMYTYYQKRPMNAEK